MMMSDTEREDTADDFCEIPCECPCGTTYSLRLGRGDIPPTCPTCRRASGGAGERACRECGVVFTLTATEARFFMSRGLKTPVRCAACRRSRRDLDTGQRRAISRAESQAL
jgi:hypothetical protein